MGDGAGESCRGEEAPRCHRAENGWVARAYRGAPCPEARVRCAGLAPPLGHRRGVELLGRLRACAAVPRRCAAGYERRVEALGRQLKEAEAAANARGTPAATRMRVRELEKQASRRVDAPTPRSAAPPCAGRTSKRVPSGSVGAVKRFGLPALNPLWLR